MLAQFVSPLSAVSGSFQVLGNLPYVAGGSGVSCLFRKEIRRNSPVGDEELLDTELYLGFDVMPEVMFYLVGPQCLRDFYKSQ